MTMLEVTDVRKSSLSDVLLAIALVLGLIYSPALLIAFVALIVRGVSIRSSAWSGAHGFMFAAICWAGFVITRRGIGDAGALLFQYLYIWILPFYFVLYAPTRDTYAWVISAVLVLFFVDLSFNVYAVLFGRDVLGRVLDERASLFGVRAGGVFGHAFYSGSISLLAVVHYIARGKGWLYVGVAILNMLFAGSWRLALLVPMVLFFGFFFLKRSRRTELVFIFFMSLLAVSLVVLTSFDNPVFGEGNGANVRRIFAWINSIDVIAQNPMLGGGYPRLEGIETINEDVISENLIAESWYLNAAVTFGVPYLLLRFFGVILVFYGGRYHNRSPFEALIAPLVIIDMSYGGFFEGALPYFVLCLVWACDDLATQRKAGS